MALERRGRDIPASRGRESGYSDFSEEGRKYLDFRRWINVLTSVLGKARFFENGSIF